MVFETRKRAGRQREVRCTTKAVKIEEDTNMRCMHVTQAYTNQTQSANQNICEFISEKSLVKATFVCHAKEKLMEYDTNYLSISPLFLMECMI